MACLTALILLSTVAAGAARAAAVDPNDVEVVQTSAALGQGLSVLPDLEFEPIATTNGSGQSTAAPAGQLTIPVNPAVRYQSVQGFGAAMTDTSAWLIGKVATPQARSIMMNELFGPVGIDLNFVRVPMGASDFTRSGEPYTYDDLSPGQTDPKLRHFSIAHDESYILPILREARAIDPRTEFLASPWSAPAWMKTNESLDNIANSGMLRPADYGPWADYFVKFLKAYQQAGVPISAVTVQNEPGTPTLYPGMNFPAAAEANWVAKYLEPALVKAGETPGIYAGDLGWGPNSNPFVSTDVFGPAYGDLAGISWHCYYGAPGVMSEFRQADPNLDEIVDECSPGGPSPTPTSEVVISSLRDWASTVALWNTALDPTGGPVQAPNHGCPGCIGLATVSPGSGSVSFTPAFYQLGQVSRFVQRGAVRIASPHFVSYIYPHAGVNVVTPGLDDVAFQNPDGSLVLVADNNGASPLAFAVDWNGRSFSYNLPAQAMVTFVWKRAQA